MGRNTNRAGAARTRVVATDADTMATVGTDADDAPTVTVDAPTLADAAVSGSARMSDDAVAAAAAACVAGTFDAYVGADRSGRARIRTAVDALLSDAVSAAMRADGDAADVLANTRAMIERQTSVPAAMRDAVGSTTSAPAVDWDAVYAQRVGTLAGALLGVLSGALRIDGTPDDYDATNADAHDAIHDAIIAAGIIVSDDADALRALACKRIGRAAPTNRVGDAILGALRAAGVDDDGAPKRLSVRDIGEWWERNGGPARSVTGGRIGMRLWPANGDATTVPGVRTFASADGMPRTVALLTPWTGDDDTDA